jgi:hypothetical protein
MRISNPRGYRSNHPSKLSLKKPLRQNFEAHYEGSIENFLDLSRRVSTSFFIRNTMASSKSGSKRVLAPLRAKRSSHFRFFKGAKCGFLGITPQPFILRSVRWSQSIPHQKWTLEPSCPGQIGLKRVGTAHNRSPAPYHTRFLPRFWNGSSQPLRLFSIYDMLKVSTQRGESSGSGEI